MLKWTCHCKLTRLYSQVVVLRGDRSYYGHGLSVISALSRLTHHIETPNIEIVPNRLYFGNLLMKAKPVRPTF